eukprot:934860-Pleurochrysis_carterae.AAC.1
MQILRAGANNNLRRTLKFARCLVAANSALVARYHRRLSTSGQLRSCNTWESRPLALSTVCKYNNIDDAYIQSAMRGLHATH